MPTSHWKALQVTVAILVLQVWNDRNGNHWPAGVLAAPAIVVIGDSTVDVGVNNYILTVVKADFPPYGMDYPNKQATGRFSNGLLIPDFIAQSYGYPLPYILPFNDPNANGEILLRGINTASSASGFLDNTASGLCVSLSQQIDWVGQWKGNVTQLVGESAAATLVSEAIFVFSTGTNDWLNTYYNDPFLQQKYDVMQYTNYLIGVVQNRIQAVYNMGARRIGVVSLPPIGCVPVITLVKFTGAKCVDDYNNAAVTFNTALQSFLSSAEASMPGSTMVYLDSYTQVYNAFWNPAQFGIVHTATNEVCCKVVGTLPAAGPLCNGASTLCTNPDDYLFFDAFHPTEFFNQKVGQQFFNTLSSLFGS